MNTMTEQPAPQPPSQDVRDIPQAHIPLVLNSIVCESLLDFKRTLVDGEWKWSGVGVDGTVRNELFDLVHDDGLAIEMLTRFCGGQPTPLGYQLNFIPSINGSPQMFQVYILQPDANGQPQVWNKVGCNRIGVGIALALCGIVQADLKRQHRQLFPGSYLSIVK